MLLFFLRDDLSEEVVGDLEEKFHETAWNRSLFRAKLNYWYQVLNYLRPFAIRKSKSSSSNHYTMYRSYFKIGWRNLLHNKGYSLINIGGLAVGMSVAMMIGMWIYDELSFDQYHQNYSRIARVMRNGTLNGETFTIPYLPYPLADELRTKYGDNFKHVVMAMAIGDHLLSTGDKKLTQKGVFIEPGAPEMLSLRMKHGSWSGLKDPHSILLSESLSRILFGDADPMDKQLTLYNTMEVKVTGVYKDLPHNTHFHAAKFLAPMALFASANPWVENQGFSNNFLDVFIEIQQTTDFEKASANIRDAILKNVQTHKEYVAANPQIFLHPMRMWHLQSQWKNGVNTGGLIQFVWLFGIIGTFVLLLACINFMNLSTARSEKRAKEVGIRKVMGSVRTQIVQQFFSESFLVVLIAFTLAIFMVAISLEWFNGIAAKQMTMLWNNANFWLVSLGFIIFTGLIAGSYPALYLSSFQPVKVLKGLFRMGRFASIPRKVLVVVQFTVSVTLVIGTIMVYQQIQFAKNRPVGYTRDGLVLIQGSTQEFYEKLDVLHNELNNTVGVDVVAQSGGPVTQIWSSQGGFDWKGKDPNVQAEFATLSVTQEYGKAVGWQFIDGRDFSRDFASDSAGFVITEGAAKLMNLENPVGETVHWVPGWREPGDFKILGVVKDMVMESPFSDPMPTIFFINKWGNWINIRISQNVETADALQSIEATFKKVIPTVPFEYKFADVEYASKFAAEERIGKLSTVFTTLAIFISCLGLFGLASFVAEQRTKEIGIRKVVGASVFSLWKLLSKDFITLVIISSILSIPLAYYILSDWLQNYDYRTDISWWIFSASGLGAILITLLTVSYQAMKAALMNPVNSLRSE